MIYHAIILHILCWVEFVNWCIIWWFWWFVDQVDQVKVINDSMWQTWQTYQFRLNVLPEAGNSAWSHFGLGQIHPQNISKMKSFKTVVREISPDLHLIMSELHQVSPDFFSKNWENAKCSSIFLSSKGFARIGNFTCRLFFPTNCKKAYFGVQTEKKANGSPRYFMYLMIFIYFLYCLFLLLFGDQSWIAQSMVWMPRGWKCRWHYGKPSAKPLGLVDLVVLWG